MISLECYNGFIIQHIDKKKHSFQGENIVDKPFILFLKKKAYMYSLSI